MVLRTRLSTYLENISTMADDLFLLTRESSFAVTLSDMEVHCRLLNGVDSILATDTERPIQGQKIRTLDAGEESPAPRDWQAEQSSR